MTNRTVDFIKLFSIIGLYFLALEFIFLRPLDVQYWQWADDALYYGNAKSIIANFGKEFWLGPFNKIVLSKAPFFSVFLAGIHSLGIPFRLSEFLLFAPLPFYLATALNPLKIGKLNVLLLGTIFLILIPAAGTDYRLLRDTLFGALVLYFLISLCGTVLRFSNRGKRSWLWAIFSGLAIGIASTTREEASWLVMPACVALLYAVSVTWRTKNFSKLIGIVCLIVLAYLTPVTLFSVLNYHSYGVYSPSLRQNKDFRNLYSVLTSLKPESRQKFVPINAETREMAYRLSPTFHALKEHLEGPALDAIAKNEAHFVLNGWHDFKKREFFVSNFEFALTEAIVLSGRNSGKSFILFCRNAANELYAAIEDGNITAGKQGFSMLPPINLTDLRLVFQSSLKSLWFLFTGEGQQRHNLSQSIPPNYVEDEWHAFLKTHPYPSNDPDRLASFKLKNRIYKIIVIFFRGTYFVFILLGVSSGMWLCINKYETNKVIAVFLLIGWAAITSFSMAMGVVHAIGFPILKWAGSYNRMGFFPLHFLSLISLISFLYISKELKLLPIIWPHNRKI